MKKILIAITFLAVGFLGLWFGSREEVRVVSSNVVESPLGGTRELIKYPAEVDTDAERLEFSIRAEEVLRLEHNVVGARFRDGEITLAQWNNYLRDEFDLKSRKISGEKSRVLQALGLDTLVEIEPRKEELEGYKTSTKYEIKLIDLEK